MTASPLSLRTGSRLPPIQPGPRALTRGELGTCVQLALGARILYDEGHDDLNQGQISARSPGEPDAFLIKQVLSGFDEATPEQMVRIAPGAEVHAFAPPEIPLHQAIYAARPDVKAIVHTHALHTLAFGALEWQLEPISHEGACFQGRIGYFDGTSHTILELDTGSAVARALGEHSALFLRNHGCVVVGSSVKEAVILAVVLERACKLQLLVSSTSRAFRVSAPADIQPKQEFIFGPMSVRTFWEYCVRRVGRRWPETSAWTA